ncbi:MAG: hypothetical protein PHS56_00545 [Eubacteriales bacterium]|nr:hypothetical protein [Eubacteriales bacterium]MDD3072909.1 hypothetical protein [Eubacteriales bacterium]MDD4079667.1 hypothetical protein [Eubacteriales bacterium]MDD4769821.1 hypothetical protein [Eubacteriales bacterium]
MDIKFENDSVEKCFEDFNLLKKKTGADMARTIKKRFDQLKAAASFSIYLSTGLGKPHSLVGDFKGHYGISISENIRLIIRPRAKGLDPNSLKQCYTVIIKGVIDYHGQKYNWLIP